MGSLHSRYLQGNLIYWDTHQKRLIDGIGADVFSFTDDFTRGVAAADAPSGWTVTLVEAGGGESTITSPDGSGGHLLLTTDANEDDGVQMQVAGEAYGHATTNYATYFGIRWQISDATQSDVLLGLCITNTTLLGGMTDGTYFRKIDGTTALSAVTEKDSTETEATTVLTVVAATWYLTEFYWDGTAVEFFVDGTSVARHTTNVCDNELLTPSIALLAGAAAAKTLTVDWIRAVQVGR